ncbi:hypothetical protein LGQ90_01125 [Gramella sp. ASW11-100T]|uniref:Uncharacterized protein n=2 Tax=Christiangramia sediminis TaxID=2881336 RepID=A0A9X1LGA5_9FLAO|nr:hypothetical protein [Christiangramia sediminis]
MKVHYISFLIILTLFSCNHKNKKSVLEQEVYYYPDKEKFEMKTNRSNIFLDSINNYGDLLERIDKVACNDSLPIINYSTKKERFELLPWYECSEYEIISSPTFRSRIFIQNDSILTNFDIKHSIDSLNIILRRHLLNKGKDFNYSDSPRQAGLEVYFDKYTNAKQVKNLLVEISKEFNELSKMTPDTLYLKILFRDRPLKLIPQIPPPKPN